MRCRPSPSMPNLFFLNFLKIIYTYSNIFLHYCVQENFQKCCKLFYLILLLLTILNFQFSIRINTKNFEIVQESVNSTTTLGEIEIVTCLFVLCNNFEFFGLFDTPFLFGIFQELVNLSVVTKQLAVA